jgi:AraC-like DNA-binding protein
MQKLTPFYEGEHNSSMDTEHIPVLYSWEKLSAGQSALPAANRHVLTGDFERHTHNFMELVLVVNGSGKHLSCHGDEPLLAGRAFIIHPGIWHAYYDCKELSVYNCCFQLEVLQNEFIWGPDDTTLQRLLSPHTSFPRQATLQRLRLTHEQVVFCQQHLESIIALEMQHNIFKLHLLGHFLLFLAAFVNPLAETIHRPEKKLLHQAIQQSIALLEDEIAFPWTLTAIAHKVGLAPSYLARLFNAQLNVTPMAYLSRKRVERAVALLEQTALPIHEIGQVVGWPDANHFARKFRAQMGISATNYRAICTQSNTQHDQTHRRK